MFAPLFLNLNVAIIYIGKKAGNDLLQKTELKKGFIYEVAASNFNAAIWTGETFLGPALINKELKFVEESHYDDGLPQGTCSPIKEISTKPLRYPVDGYNLLVILRTLSDNLF